MPKLTCVFNGRVLAVYHMDSGKVVLGSDPECDITIDSLAFAPYHAELFIDGEKCQLKTMNPHFAVYINGNEAEEVKLHDVSHGDTLRIGKYEFRFSSDGVAVGARVGVKNIWKPPLPKEGDGRKKTKDTPSEQTAYLQILNGDNIGRVMPLNQTLFQLGKKGGDCAVIARRSDGYYLSYLEGKQIKINGAFLGNESVLLKNGDLIKLGTVNFQFYTSKSQ